MNRGRLSIMACNSGKPFAEKIIKKINSLGKEAVLVDTKEIRFADSEGKYEINESIRGSDVYIVQDITNSYNGYSVYDNVGMLKAALDAAWRSCPRHISLVIPAFPFARQDKQKGREGISAAGFAREVEMVYNANQIITLDVHNEAIAGFFRKAKFENLRASKNIIDFISKNIDTENLVVMSPDAGGVPRAEYYAQKLRKKMVIGYKKRDYSTPNQIKSVEILGDVKEKNVIIVDDIIDTAGSLIEVINVLKEKGAKKIYGACSLALFNGNADDKLTKAWKEEKLAAVIGTDAVYHSDEFKLKNKWYKESGIADYFAEVIVRLNEYKSISELLV